MKQRNKVTKDDASSLPSDKLHKRQRNYCVQHETLCCSVQEAFATATRTEGKDGANKIVDPADLSMLESALVRISTKNKLAFSLFESSSLSSAFHDNHLEQKKLLTFATIVGKDDISKGDHDVNNNNDSSLSSFVWWLRPSSSIFGSMNPNSKEDKEKCNNPKLEEQQQTLIMKHVAAWLARYWTLYSSASQLSIHNKDPQMFLDNQNMSSSSSKGWSSWMYGKTTDLVTSLLARMDILDDNNDTHKKDLNDCFGDDCFNNKFDTNIPMAEDDCVTAGLSIPTSTTTINPVDKNTMLYNIEFIILCCQLLSSYITKEISSSEHSHEYDERGQIVDAFASGDGNITSSGLLLYRFMTNKSNPYFLKESESCFSLANYASRVGQKHDNQIAGRILKNLSPQHLDMLAQVLVAANYASWVGNDQSMIVIFSTQQNQSQCILNNGNSSTCDSVKGSSSIPYNVAMFHLFNSKYAIERRMEHVLIPKAEDCKRRAVHENTIKKNIPLAVLYMKRFKVLESEINRCMNIVCNMEQHISSLCMARNNAQIVESYKMLNDAMKTLIVNQEDVEEVMTQIQDQKEQSEIIHDTIIRTSVNNSQNTDATSVEEQELEKELLFLMQESSIKDVENISVEDTITNQHPEDLSNTAINNLETKKNDIRNDSASEPNTIKSNEERKKVSAA